MKELPDSSFFDKNPICYRSLNHSQASAILSTYEDGLTSEFSSIVSNSSGFKYLSRENINKFLYVTSEFAIDLMESGLKNLQFRPETEGSGCEISGGYPKNALIPFVTTPNGSVVRQMAYMRPKSESMATAPSTLHEDANWKEMTPTWIDLNVNNFSNIVYCAAWTDLQNECSSHYGQQYKPTIMSKVYACGQYNSNGKGLNKYGALFVWGWDSANNTYRLYRVKNVYYGGDEIVEVQYRPSGQSDSECVFCRYYKPNSCTVASATSCGSYTQYLLCGQYDVEVVGAGGNGGYRVGGGAIVVSGGSGAGVHGTLHLNNGNYGYSVGGSGSTIKTGGWFKTGSGTIGSDTGYMESGGSGGASSFAGLFMAGGGGSGTPGYEYGGGGGRGGTASSSASGVRSSGVSISNGKSGSRTASIISASVSGVPGPYGSPGTSGGAHANAYSGSAEDGANGAVTITYKKPITEAILTAIRKSTRG